MNGGDALSKRFAGRGEWLVGTSLHRHLGENGSLAGCDVKMYRSERSF